MTIHLESLAIGESTVTLSSCTYIVKTSLHPTVDALSDNSPIVVKHIFEIILLVLEQEPMITVISLSSTRAVAILNRKQHCPEEARETFEHIKKPGEKIIFTYHSDELMRCQCQQMLLAAGGRVLEDWTFLERLKLKDLDSEVDFADIASQVGYPIGSLLELSRHDVDRLFNPAQPNLIPAPKPSIPLWEAFGVSSSAMNAEAHPM